ncbi:hypothetical protein AM587_10004597 [Phytophthora nicotianae]|uniref:RxLR effector protein n=1 Tax=Phytophthora nicotianae TaxID=4792 RepID=A0A0W8DAD4_PHYNI|nr:hypothetical protein AM587_10004597 [Phytophthora nicotianae]
MRFYWIVLLIIATFVACTTSKTITNSFSAVADNQNNGRLLMANSAIYEHGGERANFGSFVGSLKKGTSKLAESARLQKFLLQKRNGVEVMKSLKFGYSVQTALKSSKLETLNKYITKFNKKHPDDPISMIGIFRERYGEDAVVKALVSAEMNVESAPNVAKQLQADQLSIWLNSDKSVDDVFQLLKIVQRFDPPAKLDSPKLELLDEYIAKLNSERHGHETLLDALKRGFGGDDKLVSILARAKESPRTVDKAKGLERGLLQQWGQEKLDPTRVMKLLKLDDNPGDALESGKLETFEKYIAQLNKNNPDKEVTLVGMLASKYGEIGVAEASAFTLKYGVANTMNVDTSTDLMAAKLQKQQLELWLNGGMTVDDVFKLLKFEERVRFGTGLKLDTLDEFILLYNRVKKADETLEDVLTRGLGNDGRVAEMLAKLDALDSSETKKQARKLQKRLFSKWMEEDVKPTSVFSKIFKISEADASDTQNTVASHFKDYYDNVQPTFTDPRRL